jgi:hypothetical protein
VDEFRSSDRLLVAQPAGSDKPLQWTTSGVQHALLEIHLFKDLQRHTVVHVTGKVLCPKNGIEVNRIQVNHFTGVTSVRQTLGKLLENRVTKRLGIRVGVHGQDLH